MVHWQRFPAFRHVKHELKKPHLTMSDRDRGAVFMRWKERFLVPDHRVQDINGASFAGSSSPFPCSVYREGVECATSFFFHFFYSVYSILQPLTILPLYQVSTMSALTSIPSQLRQLYDQRLNRRLRLQKATNTSCPHYQRKARRLKPFESEEIRASKEGDGRLQLALVRVLPSRQ
jgi:Vacuolar import and degradation protein